MSIIQYVTHYHINEVNDSTKLVLQELESLIIKWREFHINNNIEIRLVNNQVDLVFNGIRLFIYRNSPNEIRGMLNCHAGMLNCHTSRNYDVYRNNDNIKLQLTFVIDDNLNFTWE